MSILKTVKSNNFLQMIFIQFLAKNIFLKYIFLISISAFVAIEILTKLGLATPFNEIYVRFFLVFFYLLNLLGFLIFEIKNIDSVQLNIHKKDIAFYIALILLVVSTIFKMRIGVYSSSLYIVLALIYYIIDKSKFRINTIYYVMFLYALVMILGTIGTSKGFRIPDKSLTFIFIPLAFSISRISHQLLVRASSVFFKLMIIYLVFCVIYWWYNFQYLDYGLIEWFSGKANFNVANLQGWIEQSYLSNGTVYGAYFFVTSWAYYFHPSYISLVLFCGLILGVYLHLQNKLEPAINKSELIVYFVLLIFVVSLMQSRIGIVISALIFSTSSLYYLKTKSKNWKVLALFYILVFVLFIVIYNQTVYNFIFDETRLYYLTLGINYIKSHIWWGSGYDEQMIALKQQALLMKDSIPYDGNEIYYTHNQFVGNMVQFGILGLLSLLLLLFSIGKYAIQSRSYMMGQFLLILLLFMLIEEPLYGQKGFTIFTVFLGLFIKISESENQKKTSISENS